MGSLYLFGWQLGFAIPILIIFSSATDFLRWEAIRLGAVIFLIAVLVMLMPESHRENLSGITHNLIKETSQIASSHD